MHRFKERKNIRQSTFICLKIKNYGKVSHDPNYFTIRALVD